VRRGGADHDSVHDSIGEYRGEKRKGKMSGGRCVWQAQPGRWRGARPLVMI
jgi:hypothetical protein